MSVCLVQTFQELALFIFLGLSHVSLSYLSLSSVLHSEPKILCFVLLPKHIFCATILVPAIATPVPEKY